MKNKTLQLFRQPIYSLIITIFIFITPPLQAETPIDECIDFIYENEFHKSIDCFSALIKKEPERAYLYALRSTTYHIFEDDVSALKDMNQAIKLYKKDNKDNLSIDNLYLERADIYAYLNDYQAAIKDCTTALKINKNNIKAYKKRALLYFYTDDIKLSDKDWQTVLKTDEYDIDAIIGIARNQMERAEYDKAIELLNKHEKNYPDNAELFLYRSQAYDAKQEYNKAIDDIINYIEFSNEDNSKGYYLIRYYATKNLNYTLAKLSTKVNESSLSEMASWLFIRTTVYEDANMYQKAIEDYDILESLESDPHPYMYRDRALAYWYLGNFEKAISDIDTALKIENNYYFYYLKGRFLSSYGKLEKSMNNYNEAIELNPEFYEVYEERGWVKERLQDYEGALQDYTIAIDLNPDFIYGYLIRGRLLHLELKEYDKAKKDFDHVLSMTDDSESEYLSIRAFVLIFVNREKEAIELLNQIIASNPNDGDYYNLACAYSLMNKPAESITYLRKAFELSNQNIYYQEIDTDLDNVRNHPEYIKLIEEWKGKREM